jgi:hypothetical protein
MRANRNNKEFPIAFWMYIREDKNNDISDFDAFELDIVRGSHSFGCTFGGKSRRQTRFWVLGILRLRLTDTRKQKHKSQLSKLWTCIWIDMIIVLQGFEHAVKVNIFIWVRDFERSLEGDGQRRTWRIINALFCAEIGGCKQRRTSYVLFVLERTSRILVKKKRQHQKHTGSLQTFDPEMNRVRQTETLNN